jgi:hypothetical protein
MPDVVVPIIGAVLVICGAAARCLLNERKENRYQQKMRALVASLVVGQKVYMFSGPYWTSGTVVKVTPEGLDVRGGAGYGKEHASLEILHFDKDGSSYLTESELSDSRDWRLKINGTYECGPWIIDDMPFAERDASFEPGRRMHAARQAVEREELLEKARKLREAGGQ